MIVVVEGPDGAGKSTLIDNIRLASDKHYVSLRRSGPPKRIEEITYIIRWIEKHSGPTPLILDRHPFISEAIYGSLLRGKSLLEGYYTMYDIEEHFKVHIDHILFCRPPTETIMRKMHENPQLTGVHEKIEEIATKYDQTMLLLESWGVRIVRYDWERATSSLESLMFGEVR